MQSSDDAFTPGVLIHLGQSSSRPRILMCSRRYLGVLLLSQIFIEDIPSVACSSRQLFSPWGYECPSV